MTKQTVGRDQLGNFAEKFAQLNDDILFGEVWSREDKLSLRDRSLVTICIYMGKGLVDNSLKYHISIGKKNGITLSEIAEIITHAAFYARWPNAWAVFNIVKEVYADEIKNNNKEKDSTHGGMFEMEELNINYSKPEESELKDEATNSREIESNFESGLDINYSKSEEDEIISLGDEETNLELDTEYSESEEESKDEIIILSETETNLEADLDIDYSKSLEDDMQNYGQKDDWLESLYSENPLIGNARISKGKISELYERTKYYISKIIQKTMGEVTDTIKMEIALMVIIFARDWEHNEKGIFWVYITEQFGFREDREKLKSILLPYIHDAMKKTKRCFISNESRLEYKSTILMHALSPKKYWIELYQFLFEFYKSEMNWTYIEGDPIIEQMVYALKDKLMLSDREKIDAINISSKVYTFQESIRKLVIHRTNYAVKLISHMLCRIDEVVNKKDKEPQFYIDELCDEWKKEGAYNQSEAEKRPKTKNIATDYTRIRPVYSLVDETNIHILFPDIRLKETEKNLILQSIMFTLEKRK